MSVRRSFTVALAAAFLAGGVLMTPGSASAATCQSWGAQPPNRTKEINRLSSVAVVSPCRAWAVGSYDLPSAVGQTLIEEWTGTAWHLQQSPNVGTSEANELNGVTATSTKDAWAVGFHIPSGSSAKTLVEHWNGAAWSIVPSPSPGTEGGFFGVDATSPTDVWAVGTKNVSTSRTTLIEHWNGVKWKVVPSPNAPGVPVSDLVKVDALSATNAWAVGYAGTPPTHRSTLIEHWNGTAWKIQKSPNVAAKPSNILDDVTAVSPNDVWAVGSTGASLIEHWNGSHWSIVPGANLGAADNGLASVVATSASNVWAVGSRVAGSARRTLVEHWNGTVWKVEPSPNVGGRTNDLAAVDAASATSVWAVGTYETATTGRTLAIHCC